MTCHERERAIDIRLAIRSEEKIERNHSVRIKLVRGAECIVHFC